MTIISANRKVRSKTTDIVLDIAGETQYTYNVSK